MSEERFTTIEGQLGILKSLVSIGRGLLAAAFCLGAWSTLLEIRVQSASKDIEKLSETTTTITNWHHEANGNRYTSSDHVKFAGETSLAHTLLDKRVTRLEDNFAEMKKSLDRIETKLQSK